MLKTLDKNQSLCYTFNCGGCKRRLADTQNPELFRKSKAVLKCPRCKDYNFTYDFFQGSPNYRFGFFKKREPMTAPTL
jgi:phage FluMu protein Com